MVTPINMFGAKQRCTSGADVHVKIQFRAFGTLKALSNGGEQLEIESVKQALARFLRMGTNLQFVLFIMVAAKFSKNRLLQRYARV